MGIGEGVQGGFGEGVQGVGGDGGGGDRGDGGGGDRGDGGKEGETNRGPATASKTQRQNSGLDPRTISSQFERLKSRRTSAIKQTQLGLTKAPKLCSEKALNQTQPSARNAPTLTTLAPTHENPQRPFSPTRPQKKNLLPFTKPTLLLRNASMNPSNPSKGPPTKNLNSLKNTISNRKPNPIKPNPNTTNSAANLMGNGSMVVIAIKDIKLKPLKDF